MFWTAFERSTNPMVLTDSDRVVIRINAACTAAFGYRPDEVVGRRLDHFAPPNERKRMEADAAILLRDGQVSRQGEILHADGRLVTLQFAAHREVITGHEWILHVVLELRTRPMSLQRETKDPRKPLTRRELEVVAEIAMGRTRAQIAGELFITPATVKTHISHAMEKAGARTQAQLVAISFATGMLDAAAVTRALPE